MFQAMSYNTVTLEDTQACIAVIINVSNGPILRKSLLDGKLSSSLLNCTNILNQDQLNLAVFKAIVSQAQNCMVTRNIYSEIIYQLSPNKQISQAFKLFSMQETDKEFVAITLGHQKEKDMEEVIALSGGECRSLDDISSFNSTEAIKKTYKIEESELLLGSLSDAVISRIAGKEFLA
ncbi:EKC/KEOPS complex subunit TPRKB-like [Watersipora subatra]|uniref:EKC/KEOPS complex subunit TPRKB-like n=1 Tax=Watersipora subatra TaxID=2589382 RepID=UPI00355ACFFE